jgi:membrane dipeptidase
MAGFNAILDLSHMAEESVLEALERYDGTLIASHSNARRFYDNPRNLTDDMIRQLAERGGVIGIPLYNRFLNSEWRPNHSRKDDVTLLNDLIPAIDHVCQLTGSALHVGIGSDLDGGFGRQSIPAEFDTIADEQLIGPALRASGYTDEDVARILSGNFLRILRQTLPD